MTLVYDVDGISLYHGDCLDVMPRLEAQSIHAVICDIPYGTTQNTWDVVIPFDAMWSNIKRLTQSRSAVVLFGSEPFSSLLRCSNLPWYKYDWVWDKSNPTGHLNAKIMPLPRHEDIVVFCREKTQYNPQMRTGAYRKRETPKKHSMCYGTQRYVVSWGDQYYPTSILEISNAVQADKQHPTQKPLDLLRYLIRTYTNPGDTVLDFTSGSGTTLLAALVEGRRCIGIERDTDADGNSLGYIDYTIQRLRGDKVKTITENGTALQVVQPNMFTTI